MAYGTSSIDPGSNPTTDVYVDTVGGKNIQGIKLIDATEGSTTPVGTNTNPLRTREQSGASITTETLKTVTTSSSVVISANTARLGAWVRNISDTDIYVSHSGTATTAKPSLVKPDQSLKIISGYTGDVSAIHGGSGNKSLEVVEL